MEKPAFNPDNSPEAKEGRRLALVSQDELERRVMEQLKEGHKYVFPTVVEISNYRRPEPEDLIA